MAMKMRENSLICAIVQSGEEAGTFAIAHGTDNGEHNERFTNQDKQREDHSRRHLLADKR